MNTEIKIVMEMYPKLSLKRICDETGLCYQYVLKASKQPIAGVAYDASAFNYKAVDAIVAKKEIDFDCYDWPAIEESVRTVEPISKIGEFSIGTEFTLRGSDNTNVVVYLNSELTGAAPGEYTITEIVFKDLETRKVRVMNVDTFAHQSPRILA